MWSFNCLFSIRRISMVFCCSVICAVRTWTCSRHSQPRDGSKESTSNTFTLCPTPSRAQAIIDLFLRFRWERHVFFGTRAFPHTMLSRATVGHIRTVIRLNTLLATVVEAHRGRCGGHHARLGRGDCTIAALGETSERLVRGRTWCASSVPSESRAARSTGEASVPVAGGSCVDMGVGRVEWGAFCTRGTSKHRQQRLNTRLYLVQQYTIHLTTV
jgi:hypothetical protein